MRNIDTFKILNLQGVETTVSKGMLLVCLNKLPNTDKAQLAKNLVDLLGDSQQSRELALGVLSNRCRHCGRRLEDEDSCFCWNDD